MIQKIIEKIKKKVNLQAGDERARMHVQYILVTTVLCVVSLVMTIMNFLTGWKLLGCITGWFCLHTLTCIIIEIKTKSHTFGRTYMACGTIIMFTLFLVVGDPEGFSALWILILPACGMFLFGLQNGLFVSIAQFIVIIYLLRFPSGLAILRYEYTESFIERFPIIYLAFLFVGVLLEYMRMDATKKLNEAKQKFEYMYNHDVLTGLLNRYGFNSTLDKFMKERKGEAFSFAIFDLDRFKNVNDTYGHLNGDIVLKTVANAAEKHFKDKATVCRWGGEEFSLLITGSLDPLKDCQELLDYARVTPIELNGAEIIETFSLGLVTVEKDQEIEVNHLVRLADKNLYNAKEAGRNRIECTKYNDSLNYRVG